MSKTWSSMMAIILVILCLTVCQAYAQGEKAHDGTDSGTKSTASSTSGEISLGEISRQLDNPMTGLWSLTFEDKIYIKEGDLIDDSELANTFFFQPGLPVPLGEDKEWVFIARPVFPIVTNPVFDPAAPGGVDGHKTGFGDIQMLAMIGPNRTDGLVWGVGATFKFPTAFDDALGQDKYQAGPAAMLFNISKPWLYGVMVQNWWSYAGDNNAPDTSQTDIQYVIRYSLPDAWSIGMGPTVSIDWEADSDDQVTLPVGLGLTKTVRIGNMPVKFRGEVQYSVIKPDNYGSDWTFVFRMAPVIPSPFK